MAPKDSSDEANMAWNHGSILPPLTCFVTHTKTGPDRLGSGRSKPSGYSGAYVFGVVVGDLTVQPGVVLGVRHLRAGDLQRARARNSLCEGLPNVWARMSAGGKSGARTAARHKGRSPAPSAPFQYRCRYFNMCRGAARQRARARAAHIPGPAFRTSNP